ncbi:MAG: cupin domain-containing protein [Streptosporangiales bacterium]|nr:cupin domain-containing protein [Streptosporangiales bacterium]
MGHPSVRFGSVAHSSEEAGRRPASAEALDLLPHPEGGWYRETWRTSASFTPPGYEGPRASATGIYFLLTPGDESRWHRVRSDELWLWHRGGPLTLRLGGAGETPDARPAEVTLGPDVEAGQVPQALVPAGSWQSARPAGDVEALVTCVVSPGFDFADFQLL